MAWISGVGLTRFGRLPGADTLTLSSDAATIALDDAGMSRSEVDGVLAGYSTTTPHLMPAGLFAEYFGIQPQYAHGVSAGGATGSAMVALADHLVTAGAARAVLVVAGENRLTGQSRDRTVAMLADVGEARYEVPLGPTVPAYYALLASAYLHRYPWAREHLAALAVFMRTNAARHDGSHLSKPITIDDVLESRMIADPLRLLDCCPISDGGAAVVVTKEPTHPDAVLIRSTAQAHRHQHVSSADMFDTGARASADRALKRAGIALSDVTIAGVYDSFTITLALLLEEIGLAPEGLSGGCAARGEFSGDGTVGLNTDGGLLSHGHCGVAGGMAHVIEVASQVAGRAGARQVANRDFGLVHADGGVLSAHVSMVLEPNDA